MSIGSYLNIFMWHRQQLQCHPITVNCLRNEGQHGQLVLQGTFEHYNSICRGRANKLKNSYSAKIMVRPFSQTWHHIFIQTQQTHQAAVTHKNISLWKSSSTLTSPFVAFGTFPSTFERTSSAGRLVMSNLSIQGRSLRKSARHCFIPSCITK